MLSGRAADIKRHKWFEGLDWDALANRRMEPGRKPKEDSARRIKELTVQSTAIATRCCLRTRSLCVGSAERLTLCRMLSASRNGMCGRRLRSCRSASWSSATSEMDRRLLCDVSIPASSQLTTEVTMVFDEV